MLAAPAHGHSALGRRPPPPPGASGRSRRPPPPSTRAQASPGDPDGYDEPERLRAHRQLVDTAASLLRSRGPAGTPDAPWTIGTQVNERHTKWENLNRDRLIMRLGALPASALGPYAAAGGAAALWEAGYDALVAVVPDIATRIYTMEPVTIAALLRDPGRAATALLALRSALPAPADASDVACAYPELLLMDAAAVAARVDAARDAIGLPDAAFGRVVAASPQVVLRPERLRSALASLERMFEGAKHGEEMGRTLLHRNPGMLTSLESVGGSDAVDPSTGARQD
ncbi:unnamed protein product [Pedinophyceae sp. YPF-701]|nr:unnamed protein product [Pedinophyceae sp. YPF-701]